MAQICVWAGGAALSLHGLGRVPAWSKCLLALVQAGASSASLRRADNVSPTSLSFCKAQEATSSSQAVGEGPTHIPWPADTGEEAAAATALCIAAWGPGTGSQTWHPVRTLGPGAGPERRKVPGLAAGDGGQLLLPPTRTCTSLGTSSLTWTAPPHKLCHPKAAPLQGEEAGVPRAAGPPPATSQVSWADKGQSCPTKASGGTTSQQEGFGQGERCRGLALPIPPP